MFTIKGLAYLYIRVHSFGSGFFICIHGGGGGVGGISPHPKIKVFVFSNSLSAFLGLIMHIPQATSDTKFGGGGGGSKSQAERQGPNMAV